jgi:hypothetical protein
MRYTKEVGTPGNLALTTGLTQHFNEPTSNKVSVHRPFDQTLRDDETNENGSRFGFFEVKTCPS